MERGQTLSTTAQAMKYFFLALLLSMLCACSLVRIPFMGDDKAPDYLKDWRAYGTNDYLLHLQSYEGIFLRTEGVKELRLSTDSEQFLVNTALHILQNNELFFKESERPRFHIVQSAVPFHFSLPGRTIFLSTALIEKFIKHEAVLASIISYELVRSEKSLYNRAIIIPVGYLPLERVLGLNRLPVDNKVEIHKWAYHLIRRAGFDGEYYLSWLQLVNRNTADFLPMLGDAGAISREEALFKSFMIRRANEEDARTVARKDSSKEFYRFLFYVKDRQT